MNHLLVWKNRRPARRNLKTSPVKPASREIHPDYGVRRLDDGDGACCHLLYRYQHCLMLRRC